MSVWSAPVPGGLGRSRRVLAAVLSCVSLLGSRVATDFVTVVDDVLGLGVTAVLFYQTTISGGLVGLQLSWVLLGYLVYAYLPDLYLDYFGAVAERRWVRVVSAAATVYYGLLVSWMAGFVPPGTAFGALPETPLGTVTAMTVGLFAWMAAFAVAARASGERLSGAAGVLSDPAETFSPDDDDLGYPDAIDSLPRPASAVARFLLDVLPASMLVAPCLLLGLTLAVVNGFYPVPEALVLGGVLVSYTRAGEWLSDAVTDVEFRLADEATDAFRNDKGMILVGLCGGGLGLSGVFFVASDPLFAAERLLGLPASLAAARSPADLAATLADRWFYVGVFATPAVVAVYGLVYWVKQYRRLPAYVAYWERGRQGETPSVPAPPVARPPGLFLPGGALLSLLVLLRWQEWTWTRPLAVVVGYDVAWTAGLLALGWSVRASSRRAPQSLGAEDRDVVVALAVMIVPLGLLFRGAVFTVMAILVLAGLAGIPDVYRFATRSSGATAYLHSVYLGGLLFLALVAIETFASIPVVFYLSALALTALHAVAVRLDRTVFSDQA